MVQTIKNLMERSSDPYLALLSYRNTPGPTGSSPAQLSMGRRLRSRIPVHPCQLKPKWPNLSEHLNKDMENKFRQKEIFDKRHSSHNLKPLSIGDKVWIKDMKSPAIIKAKANSPRSYIAETPRRETVRRSRRHLIPIKEGVPDSETSFEKPQTSLSEQPPESPKKIIAHELIPDQPPASPSPVKVQSPKAVPEPPKYSRSGRLIKKPHRLDI